MGVKPLPIEFGPEDVCYRLPSEGRGRRFSSLERAALFSFGGGVLGGLLWGLVPDPQLKVLVSIFFFFLWSMFSLYFLNRYLPVERARNSCLEETEGRELNLTHNDMLISALWVFPAGSSLSFGERGEGIWYRLPWHSITSWLTIENLGIHGYIVDFNTGDVVRLTGLPPEIEADILSRLKEFNPAAKIARRKLG